ncbi:expressed unknown protein [Seminavis robusta]|uniref:U1-type domain-containing protein n=1 Tax=Seminavis robusta TaxID=568900 RepID=A0A9N8HS46_9STRA|nr:expressed unknown protein [Seminavis robusta]|eukprot:Sro1667_g289780.1 n/a (164) ;mRNA; r:6363-6854
MPGKKGQKRRLRRFVSPFRREYKKEGYHCDLCDCFVGWSKASAAVHEAGKNHKKLVQVVRCRKIDYYDCSNGYCGLCKKSIVPVVGGPSRHRMIRQHGHGSNHKRRWQQLKGKLQEEVLLLTMDETAEAIATFASSRRMEVPDDCVSAVLSFAGLPRLPPIEP